MSVLMEFAMFPTDKGESASPYVSRIVKMIKDSGFNHQLTAMGTLIETSTIEDALDIIQKAYNELDVDCGRIYSTIKFDIRKGRINGMEQKIKSIEDKM